jgi:hypothetical protein
MDFNFETPGVFTFKGDLVDEAGKAFAADTYAWSMDSDLVATLVNPIDHDTVTGVLDAAGTAALSLTMTRKTVTYLVAANLIVTVGQTGELTGRIQLA